MYQHLTIFTPTMDSTHPTHIQGFPHAAGLHVPAWVPPCPTCMAMCPLVLITSIPTCTFSHGCIPPHPHCICAHLHFPTQICLVPHMDSHPLMIITPSACTSCMGAPHLTHMDTFLLAWTHSHSHRHMPTHTDTCPLTQTHAHSHGHMDAHPLIITPSSHTSCMGAPHLTHMDTCPLTQTHANGCP